MEMLTYRILSEFAKNTIYNWDAVQNLILLNADYYDYSVEQAQEAFNKLKIRQMIVPIRLGSACVITDEGKRLHSQLQQKYGSTIPITTRIPITSQMWGSKVGDPNGRHVTKDEFFHVLDLRLIAYHDAITNPHGPSLAQHMATCRTWHMDKIRQWDRESGLLGGTLWGYGFNRICDGTNMKQQPDVSGVKLIGGYNKHHEAYRRLQMLTFQVREGALLVSTFDIDTCAVNVEADLQTRHPLKQFSFAKKVVRGQFISVEFHFTHLQQPIEFVVETYMVPTCFPSSNLAEYYIQAITELASHYRTSPSIISTNHPNFVHDFVEGIKALQEQDDNAECIRIHRAGKTDEASFRNWFIPWFKARGYTVEGEPEKGKGYIDLKAVHPATGSKIVEFKGWWNSDKGQVIAQVCKYLTEFEGDGYIFIINNTKASIRDRYQALIQSPDLNYIDGSWRSIRHGSSAYEYYVSEHSTLHGKKQVHHFVFQVHQ